MNVIAGSFVYLVVYLFLFWIFAKRPVIAGMLITVLAIGSTFAAISEVPPVATQNFLKGGLIGVVLLLFVANIFAKKETKRPI